jgi:hypothetical protein
LTRPSPRAEIALWLALLAGFSPVLSQFLRHEAWFAPSTTLVAPVLIAFLLAHGRAGREAPRRSGAVWIAAGLVLELAGIALHTWTIAWLGFPLGMLGLSLWLGAPSWRVAVLAFGLVAIPDGVRGAFTPAAESALLSGACAAWRAVGVDFSCTGPIARLGARHLELGYDDVGFTLAPLLAQLGWFLAVCEGARPARAFGRAALFGAATAVIAPLSIAVALGVFAISAEAIARAFLSPGVCLACTAIALAAARRRLRAR